MQPSKKFSDCCMELAERRAVDVPHEGDGGWFLWNETFFLFGTVLQIARQLKVVGKKIEVSPRVQCLWDDEVEVQVPSQVKWTSDKMSDRIRIFSNGSQYADWKASNCHRCTKFSGYDSLPTCDIDMSLGLANVNDGTVSQEIATRAGYDPDRYVWPCGEVEWIAEKREMIKETIDTQQKE